MIRLRTAALGLALLATSATVAAAQATTPNTQPPAGARQDGARHGGKHAGMKNGRFNRGEHGLFRGIELTADQRAKVKAIREKYQPQRKELATAMRPALNDARAARQRRDSAAAKAAFDRTADGRAKMKTLREQELREVRAVLTPAQQQTFDKNVSEMQQRMQEHQARRGRRAA